MVFQFKINKEKDKIPKTPDKETQTNERIVYNGAIELSAEVKSFYTNFLSDFKNHMGRNEAESGTFPIKTIDLLMDAVAGKIIKVSNRESRELLTLIELFEFKLGERVGSEFDRNELGAKMTAMLLSTNLKTILLSEFHEFNWKNEKIDLLHLLDLLKEDVTDNKKLDVLSDFSKEYKSALINGIDQLSRQLEGKTSEHMKEKEVDALFTNITIQRQQIIDAIQDGTLSNSEEQKRAKEFLIKLDKILVCAHELNN